MYDKLDSDSAKMILVYCCLSKLLVHHFCYELTHQIQTLLSKEFAFHEGLILNPKILYKNKIYSENFLPE